MVVRQSVVNRHNRPIFGKHRVNRTIRVMRSHSQRTNRQAGSRSKVFTGTSVYCALDGCTKLITDELSQSFIFLDDKQVIRWFEEKPLAHALSQLLQRVAALPCHCDRPVNEI